MKVLSFTFIVQSLLLVAFVVSCILIQISLLDRDVVRLKVSKLICIPICPISVTNEYTKCRQLKV